MRNSPTYIPTVSLSTLKAGDNPTTATQKLHDLGCEAAQPQDEGAKSFVHYWTELMSVIAMKCDVLTKAS